MPHEEILGPFDSLGDAYQMASRCWIDGHGARVVEGRGREGMFYFVYMEASPILTWWKEGRKELRSQESQAPCL